jgi:hypothetical protein
MEWKRNIIVALLFLHSWQLVQAESKRIEIYSLSQNYWDTKSGETLGEIAQQLLPNNPRMQQRLMKDIVALNPNTFPDNNPNRMEANARLWLPGHITTPDTKVDRSKTSVKSFAWGNIKRPIR